jgi:uncharacterized protein YkwD
MSVRRLLVLMLLVGSLLALPTPAGAGPRTTAEFIRVTNAARLDPPGSVAPMRRLKVSPTLTRLARSHSGAMARRAAARFGGRCHSGALYHNDISRKAGAWVWIGQNVGCGYLGRDGVKASVGRIQKAFMNSPGHRRNILYRKATHFGASTWIAGPVIWVTVNFKQVPPG